MQAYLQKASLNICPCHGLWQCNFWKLCFGKALFHLLFEKLVTVWKKTSSLLLGFVPLCFIVIVCLLNLRWFVYLSCEVTVIKKSVRWHGAFRKFSSEEEDKFMCDKFRRKSNETHSLIRTFDVYLFAGIIGTNCFPELKQNFVANKNRSLERNSKHFSSLIVHKRLINAKSVLDLCWSTSIQSRSLHF